MMSSTSASMSPTRSSIRLSAPVSFRMSLTSRRGRILGPSLIPKWLSSCSSIVFRTMICLRFTTTRKRLPRRQRNKTRKRRRNLNLHLNHQFNNLKKSLRSRSHKFQSLLLPKVLKSKSQWWNKNPSMI